MRFHTWRVRRRGQAISVCIGVLLLCAPWLVAAAPAWHWFEHRAERLEQRQALLRQMQAVAQSLPRLRQSLRARDSALAAGLLGGPSSAVAAALLEKHVQAAANSAGFVLTMIDIPSLPATSAEGERISLRITFSASWSQLVGFLRQVNEPPIRAFIDDVHLSGEDVGRSPIQASMVVYGFFSGVMPGAEARLD